MHDSEIHHLCQVQLGNGESKLEMFCISLFGVAVDSALHLQYSHLEEKDIEAFSVLPNKEKFHVLLAKPQYEAGDP